jgi:ABC-type multidrug transport system fused ATPase/permease subunit
LKKSFDDFDIFQSEFSGGELQKIELIESMLKDADILIIDEGTSNIDFNSEKVIFDELFAKYKDKIIILIAHRLTSVINFPRILVMHHGKIVEQGTHTYLMKKKGRYHSFWGTEESHK